MTEARIWTAVVILCALIAIGCAVTHQWLGLIGSLFAVLNAWSARWFLVRWKPSAKFE
jgi:hypothetical protein